MPTWACAIAGIYGCGIQQFSSHVMPTWACAMAGIYGCGIQQFSSHVMPTWACAMAGIYGCDTQEIVHFYKNPTLRIGVWEGRPFRTRLQQAPQGMSSLPFCPCHPCVETCVAWDLWAESL